MGADGSSPRRLTFQGNYNQTPEWSPRGDLDRLHRARRAEGLRRVRRRRPTAAQISRLTQDQGRTNEEPSWAPNGRLLVFRTDRGGPGQLVISDSRGDRQTVVAGGRGGDLSGACLGPAPQ